MGAINLTTKGIEALKPGAARREIADVKVTGLFLVLQSTGAKSWAFRYRAAGQSRKLTLGNGSMGLADARKAAMEAAAQVAGGKDPAGDAAAAREARKPVAAAAADAFETVARRFLAEHVDRKLSANSAYRYRSYIEKVAIPAWSGRRFGTIMRADVKALVKAKADTPILANRIFSTVSSLFSWALEEEIIATNPIAGMKKANRETSRDRVLTEAELVKVWNAAVATETPYSAVVRMLLLTGQRRTEVALMKHAEVDLAASLWTLPKARTKNKTAHTVPLSGMALAVLAEFPKGKSPKVFTEVRFDVEKARLDLACGVTGWTLHDLRRTCATGLQKLGVRLEVTEAVLNHKSGKSRGIVAVYQRGDFADEKREALTAWAAKVSSLLG
ncbi:tyrosine-type recombinase/integrase [Methylocella sp.]|uniref:tyrosine-type recombinase/integrase n=1 Tax=Methylocella sp. TaxID=1978226 RepID=UPI003C2150D6